MKGRVLLSAAAIALLATAGYTWRAASNSKRLKSEAISKSLRKRSQVETSANLALGEADLDEETEAFIKQASFTDLKRALETKQVTAEQVVVCLARRVSKVGLTWNAVAGVSLRDALAAARAFDQGQTQGILAGLPLGIDDSFQQQHFSCTFGLVGLAYNSQTSDGLVVKTIKSQGAIPLVRSTTSEGGIGLETVSVLWGRCGNPWNAWRAMPGTAGGAACLVATGCIPVAVVGDFGGGATISALNSGLFSLMPTPSRASTRGLLNPFDSDSESWFINLKPTVGGMARSVDDLVLLLKGLWEQQTDLQIPHVPFSLTSYEAQTQLKIGILAGDFGVELPAVTQRALNEVKEALVSRCQVENISAPWLLQAKTVFDNWVGSGNYAENVRKLSPELATNWSLFTSKTATSGSLIKDTSSINAYQYFIKHRLALDNLRDAVRDSLLEYDVLILPSLASPAWPPLFGSEMESFNSSTVIGSLFNLPCGTVPVTTVRTDEQTYAPDNLHSKTIRSNLKDSVDLPVGVVVISRPFYDEIVLRVMKELQISLCFNFPIHS